MSEGTQSDQVTVAELHRDIKQLEQRLSDHISFWGKMFSGVTWGGSLLVVAITAAASINGCVQQRRYERDRDYLNNTVVDFITKSTSELDGYKSDATDDIVRHKNEAIHGIQQHKTEATEYIRKQLGDLSPPKLTIISLTNKRPITSNERFQMTFANDADWIIPFGVKNEGGSPATDVCMTLYCRRPLNLFYQSVDEPAFDFQQHFTPDDVGLHFVPVGMADEFGIAPEFDNANIEKGSYELLLKVFYGNNQVDVHSLILDVPDTITF